METFKPNSSVIEERRLLQSLARDLRRRSFKALLGTRSERAPTSEPDHPDRREPVPERN